MSERKGDAERIAAVEHAAPAAIAEHGRLQHGGKRGETRLYQIPGNPPNLINEVVGDPFAPRNAFATERCLRETPPLKQVEGSKPGHEAAVWYDLRKELQSRETQA